MVRIGFDDDRALGDKETRARTALPIFREVMLRIDEGQLVGPVPQFARAIDDGIDQYLARQAALTAERDMPPLQTLGASFIVPTPVDQGPISIRARVH